VLVPGGEQTKAYRLLADVMASSRRAAIASFVMRGKAHAIAIFADNGILRGATLRFADELRDPSGLGVAASTKVDAKRAAAISRAISKLEKKGLDEKELSDSSGEQLLELARKKLKRGEDVVEAPQDAPSRSGEEGAASEAGAGGEVVDLLALIQKRLRESSSRKPRASRPSAKRRAPSRARRRR
jgi:DNA end-binding protein Ku